MTQPAPPAGIAAQLASARAVLDHPLGGALQALYLFGSAVDGGLKPHSDIDLLAIVDAPLAEPARRGLMTGLLAVSAWPGTLASCRALEVTVLALGEVVPWRYPPRRELQFGEWLRDDLRAGLGAGTPTAPAPPRAGPRAGHLPGRLAGWPGHRPEPMAAFVGHVKAAIGKAFTQDP